MGDCHYWLRPKDAHHYKKPGKDFDAKLGSLGAGFHGIHQQDDCDIRGERQAQGVEPDCAFMIRVGMPGRVCDPSSGS